MKPFLSLPENTAGNDWIVGDVHGCADELRTLLTAVHFNPARDRLFLLGDLIDRGPENFAVLDLLHHDWCYALLGNHEMMMMEFTDAFQDPPHPALVHATDSNGGKWYTALSQDDRLKIAAHLRELPYAIEIPVKGELIGMAHAEPPNDWAKMRAWMHEHPDAKIMEDFEWNALMLQLLWGRDLIRGRRILPDNGVANVDLVCVGHTPVKEAARVDNVLFLDTGCVFGRKLTGYCPQTLQEVQVG